MKLGVYKIIGNAIRSGGSQLIVFLRNKNKE